MHDGVEMTDDLYRFLKDQAAADAARYSENLDQIELPLDNGGTFVDEVYDTATVTYNDPQNGFAPTTIVLGPCTLTTGQMIDGEFATGQIEGFCPQGVSISMSEGPLLGVAPSNPHPVGEPLIISGNISAEQITGRALRYNTGKAKLSFAPLALLEAAADVLRDEPDRFENTIPLLMESLLNHAYAWLEGDDNDRVTGRHRFKHMAADIACLLHMHKTGVEYVVPANTFGLAAVPRALVEGVSRALVYGANKYSRNNWRRGFPHTELVDCLLRHAYALLSGEECDEESGLHHLDHIAANVAFLCHMLKTGGGVDDRAVTIH